MRAVQVSFKLAAGPVEMMEPRWARLDVSAAPDGILFERHIGAVPVEVSRVEVVAVAGLAAALGRGW